VDRLYDRLARARPGAVLHNLGRSGATTGDVVRIQLPRAAKFRPDLVTLAVGTNDLTDGASVEQVLRNLTTTVTSLRAAGAAVVVANLPAVGLAPAVPPAYRAAIDGQVRAVNHAIEEICRENNASLFDLYALSKTEIPRHPEYFSWDGYHPSDEGYERWAQAMWPAVEETLARPR
jgi:lysophospholipase L1-like esterase